ncbi:hypothetical protein CCHL11_04127 [Colletotrichum chlorophyti]|uniref:BTB domain-containing protein n=1 Tax=Colletotrichum chlorophyti TaxID=708187 RepID=A0A1Q8RPL4_9PEZI|nr:hypothetical protein CCHL11_04127 [Colletotrichum chlorophyti]
MESPVVFDPDGDLYLEVGEEADGTPQTYLVCSKALSRASVVFRKMLYGGFAESRPTGGQKAWLVRLPEDDQKPFELMLSIIHLCFDKVPERLELKPLFCFLVLADRYDATAIARPWAKKWLEAVKSAKSDPILLGVAYELGDTETFTMMANKILEDCFIDGDGDVVFGSTSDSNSAHPYKLRDLPCLAPPDLTGE